MSSQIQCRQCGKSLSRSDFPTGQFKCPDCNWSQMLSSGRSGARKRDPEKEPGGRQADRSAGATTTTARDRKTAGVAAPIEAEPKAPAVRAAPAAPAATRKPAGPTGTPPPALAPLPVLDLEGLRALTAADFTLWCCSLLARFGYVVSRAPENDGASRHLELHRAGDKVLVDCVAFGDRENVGRPEGQSLIDAMEQRGIARGLLLSPGSFENGCRALAQRCGAGRVQLIDGARLELTAREIANGPLAAWWS